jgi:hypothetical protein
MWFACILSVGNLLQQLTILKDYLTLHYGLAYIIAFAMPMMALQITTKRAVSTDIAMSRVMHVAVH